MQRRMFMIGGGVALAGATAGYVGLRRMGSMEEYDAWTAATRAALSAQPDMRDLIRLASLAPNGHNAQPWRFQAVPGRITILPDFSRRTPVVDPDDHHLSVALGCAAENLALATGARGCGGEIGFDPTKGAVTVDLGTGGYADNALVDAIPRRQSTRAEFDGRAVDAADLRTLAATAAVPGVDLALINDRAALDRMRDLVVAANGMQMANLPFVRELKSWIRFSPAQAMASGDGLFSVASGNPALPGWLGSRLFDWMFTTAAENDRYARQLRSSPGVAVFVAHKADPEHWVRVGRASQRFALQATALGLKLAFVNQPVEVASFRPELASLVGLSGRRPDIVMRFGYGPALPFSARRPVAAVLA